MKTNNSVTSCKSEEGITVGLIDSIINSLRLLRKRSLKGDAIKEALIDFRCDKDLEYLLNKSSAHCNINTGFKVKDVVIRNTGRTVQVRKHYTKYSQPTTNQPI